MCVDLFFEKKTRYQREVLSSCDVTLTQALYAQAEQRLRHLPRFVCWEEDLPATASAACVATHAQALRRLLATHWPDRAPWEVATT